MLSEKVKVLTDKLIATYLAKGVQPIDIADNMFEDSYVDMKISKNNDSLVMTFAFEDSDDEQTTINSMRYTYSKEKVLLRVEQKLGRGRYKIQWDREEDLQNIVCKLIETAQIEGSIDALIGSLPYGLKKNVLKSIAA